MTRKHFEFMAEWIGKETPPGGCARSTALDLAVDLGRAFNPNFDVGRFLTAVDRHTPEVVG